ncbi:MAG: DUF559 domain-containing protein [Asticcacaulis sp.]|nr:DUF559 domain-containing protein [Asticcacaulis sp.]
MTQPNLQFARQLRKKMSLPEVLLWKLLKVRKAGRPVFRRQYPYAPYVFDFYCAEIRLVLEIDGVMHSYEDRPERDEARDAYLQERGFEVVRIYAVEVLRDPDDVAERIWEIVAERTAGDRSE